MTHVTNNREPLLTDHVDLLQESIENTRKKYPFIIIAWVILPDHFHMIINPLEGNLSSLMRIIKLSFSKKIRNLMDAKGGRIWQNRYWDHIIRNEEDLNLHIDYIHYNPVKHDVVGDPFSYFYSSIHEYYMQGFYSRDWGVKKIKFPGEYGE
ncbi:MAG: transposase [candidate division Zixibacteria bacterium]|nr:transposase [candidate division Zixibacteria bacterium]MDD5427486.1 transposase [candidate division Zixibacteria bacterium]